MSGSRYKENWRAADVQCPFFLGESAKGKEIVCEGFTSGMKVKMHFSSAAAKNKHMGHSCVGPYKNCPIYQSTMGKYSQASGK